MQNAVARDLIEDVALHADAAEAVVEVHTVDVGAQEDAQNLVQVVVLDE